jgi:CSLREA domain-containing protein
MRSHLAAAVAVALAAADAQGATFTVTKTSDTRDGACDADCSLREAVIAANQSPGADVIVLPSGDYALTLANPVGDPQGNNDATAQTGDLDLTDDVAIQGAGSGTTSIDAHGLDRVFETLSSGLSVQISGVTLSGGSQSYGGAILNRAKLTLNDVVVTGSTARNGGGILNTGSLSLTSCTVGSNTATTSGSMSDGFGGGIENDSGGQVVLTGSTLQGNRSDRDGGGLFSLGTATLTNATISANTSGAGGGGVGNAGMLGASGSTISANHANDGGAIACFTGSTATIDGSTISGNSADGLDLGGGGGIFNYQGDVTVTNTTIDTNTAYGEGGAGIDSSGTLRVTGGSIHDNQALWHDPSTLPSNTAPGLGGGVLLVAGGTATLSSTTIASNVAGISGGGIYNDRSAITTVDATSIRDNQALGTGKGGYGGGILNEGNLTVQNGSDLTGNQAAVLGGGLSTAFDQTTLTDTSVAGNTAGQTGGGVYCDPVGHLTLTRVSIASNHASSYGGGLFNDGTLTAMDGALDQNTADQTGAGAYNSSTGHLTLTGTRVSGNQTTGNGGGMWNEGSLAVDRAQLLSNLGSFGGAIGNRAGSATLTNTTVDSNQASQQGGGVYNFGGGAISVLASTISHNVSLGSFGGGLANESAADLMNSTLAANTATLTGCDLLNNQTSGPAQLSLENVTLVASGCPGGAIADFSGTVSFADSLVSGSCFNDAGMLSSLGYNLESPGATCFSSGTDRVSVANPMLGPLAANGGPTQTFYPLLGSPAIDTGNPAGCYAGGNALTTDQRGFPRPIGARCDVGAVEVPEASVPSLAFAASLAAVALRRVRGCSAGRERDV